MVVCSVPSQSAGRRVELDERTYRYFALDTVEGSPYGVPLFAGAINAKLDELQQDDQVAAVPVMPQRNG